MSLQELCLAIEFFSFPFHQSIIWVVNGVSALGSLQCFKLLQWSQSWNLCTALHTEAALVRFLLIVTLSLLIICSDCEEWFEDSVL